MVPALGEGLRLYQEGKVFAAHETRENVWLESQEPEKMCDYVNFNLDQNTSLEALAEVAGLSTPLHANIQATILVCEQRSKEVHSRLRLLGAKSLLGLDHFSHFPYHDRPEFPLVGCAVCPTDS